MLPARPPPPPGQHHLLLGHQWGSRGPGTKSTTSQVRKVSSRPSSGVSPTGCFLGSWPAWARPCRGHPSQLLALIPPEGGQPPALGIPGGFGLADPPGKCWSPRHAPCSAEALAGPSWSVQPERDGLVLIPPWSSVPAHAGVCGQHPHCRDPVRTDLLAIRKHTTRYQRFLFIFNQDSPPTLFSYKFACCKQVCKDPFFGEIRVRMNTLRQGDASILRCFGANSFSHCQPLAMP
ncbi:unnamed protein product [Rangifer tarandus platyrhynchus]|uniref:Uncharacterized protein n=2 Tax=Rangifer tarandus platyrhynchus TaxID=3082113 RepID=A0ABN8ZR94_RANTA|nr:unnamed protein product [Rangifer tarandus platyrhynchus]